MEQAMIQEMYKIWTSYGTRYDTRDVQDRIQDSIKEHQGNMGDWRGEMDDGEWVGG